MADKDAIKLTKQRIAAMKEMRKLEGELTAQQAKTLDGLRATLKELRGLDKHQQKLINKGGVYADLSKQWSDNAMSDKKNNQELGKVMKGTLDLYDSALKGQLSSEDVAKQRISLEAEQAKIAQNYFGSNKELGKELDAQLQFQIGSLNNIEDINDAYIERGDLADELTNKLNFFQRGWDDVKQKIGDAWSVIKANPIKSVMGLLAVGVMAVGKHLIGIVKGAVAMQKELGVGAGFAMDLDLATREAAAGSFMYGESVEDVRARAGALVEEWGVINQETKKSITAANDLERMYGVSTTSAAQIAQMMESTSSSTKDVLLKDMAGEMKSIQKSGIPVGKVMEEVASDTDFFAGHMKDGGKNIIKAAAFAKKLGMSMSTISGASEKLLDFESSINAEMEASVLLGRSVNMERARELAFAGDLEGMQKEIMKQVGSEADFARMNVVQREALAEAAGLTLTDLSKMVAAEEKLMTMSAEDLAQQKQNQKVTNNIQKIWQAVVGVFQTLYQKFITPMGKKFMEIMSISGDMTGEFELGKDAIEALSAYIEPIFQWVSDTAKEFAVWVKELGTVKGEAFSIGQVFTSLKEKIIAIWDQWKGWLLIIGLIVAAIVVIPPILAYMAAGGAAAGGGLAGMGAGLSALGGMAPLAAKGIGIIVLAMLGFALGIYALSKAIEYGEKGFRMFFEVVGGFVLDVLGELVGLIVQLAPHVVNLASVVGGVLIDAFRIYKDLVIGIVEAISGLITGVFTSIYTTFEKFAAIGRDGGLGMAAIGILAIGAALAGFGGGSAVGGILSSIGNFFGGDPVKKFQRFAALGPGLTTTAQAMRLLTDSMEAFSDLSIDNEVGSWFKGGVTKIQLVSDADKIRREVTVTDKRTSDKLDKVITLLEKQPTFDSTQTNVKKTISSIEGAFANR
jgi:hypothetical protein